MGFARNAFGEQARLPAVGKLACVAVAAVVAFAGSAVAGCKEDVAKAFEKQRDTAQYRMKTRQLSSRGLVFLTIDYLLPFKMHQVAKSATSSETNELILIGPKAWNSSGLGWFVMGADATKALNQQFGASVLNPPEDKLKYVCLGQIDVDGRTLAGYQAKQGSSENVRTDSELIRTVYIDPESGLPVRSTVARADKPDVAFFKADYSYPTDIVIEPPKNAKPIPGAGSNGKEAPPQSKKPI